MLSPPYLSSSIQILAVSLALLLSGQASGVEDFHSQDIAAGVVKFAILEGLPANDRWPAEDQGELPPTASMEWTGSSLLLPRIPARFDSWGIRDAWKSPVLLRASVNVQFPAGKHQIILRARGLGRLWLDDQIIASTKPVTRKSPDGEQPVSPVPIPPAPGLRPHDYHHQEVIVDVEVSAEMAARQQQLLLEVVVGGKGVRTETGELLVAFQSAQDGAYHGAYHVITPINATPLSLNNDAVENELRNIEQSLIELDDQSRRTASASMDDYWNKRHELAKTWTLEQTAHPLPTPESTPSSAQHPIDLFIQAKIDRTQSTLESQDAQQAEHFSNHILPLLRDQCFRCHGEKQQGGLKLNSRDAALQAGDSEIPAIVPGDPEASELISQVRSGAMPPTDTPLTEQQIMLLEDWIRDGAVWAEEEFDLANLQLAPTIDDSAFLRRAYLDTVGVPPSILEIQAFQHDPSDKKRERLIETLLQDPRVAGHQISFWQDLLAENPTLVNASMASTGPFRWFLYDSLKDNKPLDRMVTELIMMRGDVGTGGSAAFGLSGESDAPMAEKAHILASAFLGVELQCARCHDSPYHSTTQSDLYSLAAMLARKDTTVPKTSRVPAAFFEKSTRQSLIKVTLKPDAVLQPTWTLEEQVESDLRQDLDAYLTNPDDSREQLAALFTAPQNRRFGRVMVNRIWQRLMGAAFVQPLDDWEGAVSSHPELLDWLVDQLVLNHYDVRALMRILMTSQAYQRQPVGNNFTATAEHRFFNAPDRRRMSAEQVADSLHAVTNKPMDSEELTFVHDGARPLDKRQTLGKPSRAWMFASLNNERDRPSLSLPRARAVVDVLHAFGWDGARQRPISLRETEPNVLQPGILANGALVQSLTRATPDSVLSAQALKADDPSLLVEQLFWQILTRPPSDSEKDAFTDQLRNGFDTRRIPAHLVQPIEPLPLMPLVTWFNHLRPETTHIQQEHEQRVAIGPAADPQIEPQWRSAFEDAVWSLINHREFIWIP